MQIVLSLLDGWIVLFYKRTLKYWSTNTNYDIIVVSIF